MAKRMLEIPLEDGGVAVFEVDPSDLSEGMQLASESTDDLTLRAQRSLQSTLTALQPAISSIRAALAHASPERVEVEFGIKIGGESGVIFAKGTAEANFTARISWSGHAADRQA